MDRQNKKIKLGKRLKEARQKKGLTLNEVAIKLGKQLYTYYNYERGFNMPKRDTLMALEIILDANFLN